MYTENIMYNLCEIIYIYIYTYIYWSVDFRPSNGCDRVCSPYYIQSCLPDYTTLIYTYEIYR